MVYTVITRVEDAESLLGQIERHTGVKWWGGEGPTSLTSFGKYPFNLVFNIVIRALEFDHSEHPEKFLTHTEFLRFLQAGAPVSVEAQNG